MIPKNLYVVDLETTGLKPWVDMICEIGIVHLNTENGTIRPIYDKVVKHGNRMKWVSKDSWIFVNSYLSYYEVLEASDIRDYKAFFYDLFRNKIVTAYNKEFDIQFLRYNGIRVPNEWEHDIMKELTEFCDIPHEYYGKKYPSVQEAYDKLFPDSGYEEKHRALDDAYHEAQIIYEAIKRGIIK